MPDVLLSVRNLRLGITEVSGFRKLITDESFEVRELSTLALVGGSGCGKTMTGLSILGLLPSGIRVQSGEIIFNGEDLLKFLPGRMRRLRGKEIGMIFQEPLSAFNPVFNVGFQIEEVLKYHTALNRGKRREKVWQLLDIVGIPDPKRCARSYPHQLSGGLRQRAMIAQAIAAGPKLVIADEPTSNLDVTLQAVIIELFRKLKKEIKVSMLLITHDWGVVKELADDVAVLSQGRIVEQGTAAEVLAHPRHPFTRELIAAIR